jgi:hypothetical protein
MIYFRLAEKVRSSGCCTTLFFVDWPQRVGYQGGQFLIHHFFDRLWLLRLRFVPSRGPVIHAVNAPMSGARWNE